MRIRSPAAETLRPGIVRRFRRYRIRGHERFRGTLDALHRARYEIATVRREVECFTRLRLSRVWHDGAISEELQAAVKASSNGKMALEEITGTPVTYGDAEAIPEMILGVARHVDTVPPSLRNRHGVV